MRRSIQILLNRRGARGGRYVVLHTLMLLSQRKIISKERTVAFENAASSSEQIGGWTAARWRFAMTIGGQPTAIRKAPPLTFFVRRLYNSWMDVNVTRGGSQPLITAAQMGELNEVLALNRSLNADATDSSGYTALHYAASHGFTVVARYLIDDRKADPNLPTLEGETPLILSAKYNHSQTVEMLLRRNVNTEFRDQRGRTALHYAVERMLVCVSGGFRDEMNVGSDEKLVFWW